MGKALKTAGAIIGGAVLMATGVGALAGVQVTAMGIAGIGTMSVANLQLMSAGLMAAGSMLDKPKSTASGSPSDWTSNPDQGIPFLFGRMGVAGKIVHRDEYGQDNRLQGIVTIYSGAGPVKSFQGFTADELPVSFVTNGGTAVGKYNRQMWRSWRMGAQPDTALSLPTGLDGGAVMPMWGPLYKLSGKACDLLTLQQDSKFSVYPSGEPKPMQVLEGVYGYDPRYDDTYPGGAGPCRYGVRSTYRYIDNAIIAALNWALGMVENGQVVGGIGASLQGVDLPAFVEAANIADANAWTVAAWPDTSEDASVVLDELLEAGGAKRSRVAGKISCVSRGAPRPSIVTITRRDTAGAIELDTGASRFNRLNTITPVIMSEAHKWQHAPMNPVSFAPLVAEDGGKRSDQIKYRFVPKVKQGAELAAYDILDAREPFAGTIPLLPHLRRLKPGDCFDIDEPGFMLDGVKMLVLGRAYVPKAGEVRIAFRSETDSKHPLALGKTTTMPAYPGLTAPDPTEVSPPQPGDWTIIPRPPAPGGQLPVIDLSGIVSNATADAMLINWREVVEGEDPTAQPPFMDEEGELLPGWVDAGVWPPTTRTLSIQGPQPGAQIWIAIRYKRGNNVSPAELAGPITVGDLIAGGLAPDARETIIQDIIEQVDIDVAEGLEAGREALERSKEMGRALIDAAVAALEGTLSEEKVRHTEIQDALDRLGIAIVADPIARTGLVRKEVMAEGVGPSGKETFVQMNTRLTAVDAGLGLAVAQVEIDAKAYSDGLMAAAYLTLATKAELGSAIAASRLEIEGWTNGQISTATANLITSSGVDGKIAAARLSIESWTNGQISTATANLATVAQMNAALAASELTLKSYADNKVATATANLATKAELASGLSAAELNLKSYTDGKVANAIVGLISASAVDAKIATASLALSSEIDSKVATATANLVSAAELSAALAGAELSLKGYTDNTVSNATATLASKAEVFANQNLMPNGSGELGLSGWTGAAGLQAAYWQPFGGHIVKQPITGAASNWYVAGPTATVSGAGSVTLSWRGGRDGGYGGTASVYLVFRNASGGIVQETARKNISTPDADKFITAAVPAGATSAHLSVYINGTGGAGQAVWLNRVKIENGTTATAYTLDGSAQSLAATAAIQADAIADAAAKLSQARLRLVTAAGGGNPAVVELYSDNAGASDIRLLAGQIQMGENTILDTTTGLETSYFGTTRRVVAKGAAFGASPDAGQLTEWEGPNSVAMNAMTRANAYYYRANTAPRHGGSAVAGSADGGRRLIAFTGKATNGTTYSNLGSAAMQVSAGSIVQATVSTTFYDVSPSGAGGLDGSLQLWEQDASGRSNIGPSVVFTAVDAEFIAKSMIGVGTKSGAVTYGVDWRASTGSVNAINAQGQIDLMVMRGT